MKRREFTKKIALGSSLLFAGASSFAKSNTNQANNVLTTPITPQKKFTYAFAPNFDQLGTLCKKINIKNKNPQDWADKVKAFSDLGFTAIEYNPMGLIDPECQKAVGKELERQNMQMGIFVSMGDHSGRMFTGNIMKSNPKQADSKAVKEHLKKSMIEATEVAKRVNAKWTTVVPSALHSSLAIEYQTQNVIENLKVCADVCEKTGLIMVLEPLNFENHPGIFLQRSPQAYQICKAVDSPCCKILFDIFHQQITEGNLISNINLSWDEIAYFQIADVPGRKEAGTGEINFENIFKVIYDKGYRGPIGLEHRQSVQGLEGDNFFMESYRKVDKKA